MNHAETTRHKAEHKGISEWETKKQRTCLEKKKMQSVSECQDKICKLNIIHRHALTIVIFKELYLYNSKCRATTILIINNLS